MQTKRTVLIADPNEDYRQNLQEWIEQEGDLRVVADTGRGDILAALVTNHQPDVLVMALNLGETDGIEVLEQLARINLIRRPRILVVSSFMRDGMTQMMADLGVDYFLAKPCHPSKICLRIRQISGLNTIAPAIPLSLDLQVSTILQDIGMPAHINGYRYLRFAILETVKDAELMHGVTKILYPMVAKSFHSTPARVERSIRHAIGTAWERGQLNTLHGYFGYTISYKRGKPTNAEFIAKIADNLRLQYQVQ